jgi:lipoate-protein ligase A
MTPCRLIVDPPLGGAWNMAVDETLLEDAAERGAASLRFYQWHEPTLSLGYFQPVRERASHPASQDAAIVRRLSGGGALLHDRELTYSLCLPATHPLARQSAALYETVHEAIIETLAAWNLSPALAGGAVGSRGAAEPFLCFDRRTEFDVVLPSPRHGASSAKIVGSAQRRRRGAVLQHGAVLLGASPLAPELKGVADVARRSPGALELASALAAQIGRALELDLQPQSIEGQLRETAQQLEREKYARRSWTDRR